jgi:malate synthase
VRRILEEEYAAIRTSVGDEAFSAGRYADARTVFADVALDDDYLDFLTLPAYDLVQD